MTPTIIGNATLYLGDCLEILPDVRKQAAYTDFAHPSVTF